MATDAWQMSHHWPELPLWMPGCKIEAMREAPCMARPMHTMHGLGRACSIHPYLHKHRKLLKYSSIIGVKRDITPSSSCLWLHRAALVAALRRLPGVARLVRTLMASWDASMTLTGARRWARKAGDGRHRRWGALMAAAPVFQIRHTPSVHNSAAPPSESTFAAFAAISIS